MTRLHVLACSLALLTAATSAFAQPPAFVVERPSFSTPPDVVGRGFWQVEAGMVSTRDTVNDDTRSTLTLPNAVVRLGVTRRLELRAATVGLLRVSDGSSRTSATDVQVGMKYQLASSEGLGVDLSLIPMVSVPTGSGAGTTGNADPSVIVTAARGLGASNLNLNLKWTAPTIGDADNERARLLDWSAVLSFPIGTRWSAFVEGVASDDDTDGAPVRWTGNAGIARMLGANARLDLHAGRGLNDAAPDWAIGTGVAWRLHR